MEFKIASRQEEVELCYKVRTKVFVEEQNVPISIEIDEKETISTHFYVIDDAKVIAVGRIYNDNGIGVIGRIAVLKESRGIGVGLFLMQNIIDFAKQKGFLKVLLGSQEQALGFYEKLGFAVCSDMYFDADIPHFKMQKVLSYINK